jgi:hypothetical protein
MIHSRHSVIAAFLLFLFLANLLASCSTPWTIAELPTVTSPAQTFQPAGSSTASPGVPVEPTPSAQTSLLEASPIETGTSVPEASITVPDQPTPEEPLGGGTIQDGPFLFDLRLFRDPTLSQQPITTSLYSDLNGVGTYMYWFYQGPDVIGPVETYFGTLPSLDQLSQASYPSISLDSSGGRTGGIVIPGGFFLSGESKVGDRIRLALKVVTPKGKYGAVLGFTLKQGANGFEPTDISIDVLPPDG